MKYKEFVKAIDKPYFTRADIRIKKLPVFDYQISLWRSKGEIEQLKRGLYLFTNRRSELTREEVAFLLYEPSYISLESALSGYGLIPEMVPTITAVTTRPTRNFSNGFGKFIFRTVSPKLFFGYEVKSKKCGKYLYAHPEKALLDYFYLNQRTIRTKEDIEGIRFNYEEIKNIINKKRLKEYLTVYNSKRVENIINTLLSLC